MTFPTVVKAVGVAPARSFACAIVDATVLAQLSPVTRGQPFRVVALALVALLGLVDLVIFGLPELLLQAGHLCLSLLQVFLASSQLVLPRVEQGLAFFNPSASGVPMLLQQGSDPLIDHLHLA